VLVRGRPRTRTRMGTLRASLLSMLVGFETMVFDASCE
jgi:hypothetical protein